MILVEIEPSSKVTKVYNIYYKKEGFTYCICFTETNIDLTNIISYSKEINLCLHYSLSAGYKHYNATSEKCNYYISDIKITDELLNNLSSEDSTVREIAISIIINSGLIPIKPSATIAQTMNKYDP